MVTSGFVINGILQTVINIAVVAMTKKDNETTQETFNWTESQKQDVLGIFFWGFSVTRIPCGRLAEVIGARKVIGYSTLLASLLTISTPIISHWNYYLLLSSRVLMGILIGANVPAVMPLAVKWVPVKKQSLFMSCVSSCAVGTAIAYHLCGFLISAYGWTSAFYMSGILSFLWSIAWFYLIFDSPQAHPRISFKEKDAFQKMEKALQIRKVKFSDVPWKQIITSRPVWAICIAQATSFFVFVTIVNELPTYMEQILSFDIKKNGIFSGLPFWGMYFSSLISGYLADGLQKSGTLSTTTIRKIFESIALLCPAIILIFIGLWGDITIVALILFGLILTTNATVTSGHCANMLDISPNFSGTICGMVNTIGSFTSYFSSKVVAALIEQNNSFQTWSHLFWILSFIEIVGITIYLIFCSGDIQKWDSNKYDGEKMSGHTEMYSLSETIAT